MTALSILGLLSRVGWRRAGLGLAAIAALGFGAWVWSLRAANASLREDRAALEQTLARAEARLAAQGRAMDAMEASLADARTRAARTQSYKSEVMNAPPSDDGSVAPVLERAFERLREAPR